MRKFVYSFVAIALLIGQTHSSAALQPAHQKQSAAQVDEAIKAFRADLQAERADIMAKNISLTADQAAKFWPVYAKFQAEQAVITDEQLKAVKQYAETFKTLDDAGALAHVNALLSRDLQINTLRTKWLAEFQKVLPIKLAARVIQVDRRLGLAYQMFISSQLPLIE